MSLNKNVPGNSVRTKRGTKVTADPDFAKKEFQKRRRIRLEQVRQQSKDIAEDVRNKVRKDKSKQLSNLERRGEEELKKWQACKLSILQQQYQECLKDIGLGHVQATLEEESDCAVISQKESFDQAAKERGQQAIQRVHKEKQQERLSKSTSGARRQHNKNLEDTRANLVANLNRNKPNSPFKKIKTKRKAVVTDVPNGLTGGSGCEPELPEILNLSSSNPTSRSCSPPAKFQGKAGPDDFPVSERSTDYATIRSRQSGNQDQEKKKAEKQYSSGIHRSEYSAKMTEKRYISPKTPSYPVETRISDRIKRRNIVSAVFEPVSDDIPDVNVNTLGSPKRHSHSTDQTVQMVSAMEESPWTAKKFVSDHKYSQEQIPTKPTVTLRTDQAKSLTSGSSNLNKVQYYDHKNRFFKEYIPDNASVQKIDVDSLEVRAGTESETEFVDHMYKRDRIAQARGQKALQKVKVHRDYQEMMQQLPMLQNQERIASIPAHKAIFHMSEDRLKEHGKKRQHRLESAYETFFPKPQVVTIPPKVHSESVTCDLPFQAVDFKGEQPILNVGSWDFDSKKRSAPIILPKNIESDLIREAVKKIPELTSDADTASQRKENLQEMLQNITSQRNRLAKELSSLPESSHLHQLFGQFGNIDAFINTSQVVNKKSTASTQQQRSRQRQRTDRSAGKQTKVSSSSLSPSYRLSKSPKEPQKERSPQVQSKISKYHVKCASASSSSPSPPTKLPSAARAKPKAELKPKKPPIILQNTGTQTTPGIEKPKEDLSKARDTSQTIKEKEKPLPPAAPSKCQCLLKDSRKPRCDEGVEVCKCCKNARRRKEIINEFAPQGEQEQQPHFADKQSQTSTCEKETGPCMCCTCGKNRKEACEIVIKIAGDGEPQISVSPVRFKDNKIVVTETEVIETAPLHQSKPRTKSEEPVPEKLKPKATAKQKAKAEELDKAKAADKQRPTKVQTAMPKDQSDKNRSGVSWREQFSRNSTNSSTSYYSPPTPAAAQNQPQYYYNAPPTIPKAPRGHLRHILRDKPQQGNLPNSSTPSLTPCGAPCNSTLQYIKRLLAMSRGSVEDLAVSSVSDVSTPNSSIVNVQSNLTAGELQSVMKHLNINFSDIERFLNYTADGTNVHYNTPDSGTPSSRSESSQRPQDVRDMTLDEYTELNYPGVLVAYNKLAENCAKKIENLAAMIEKVRLDKLSILQSPGSGSDKENSTKYMDLPEELRRQKLQDQSKSSASDSTAEQEELNRQLLEIDYSFAEQLKKMTAAEIREKYPLSISSSSTDVAEDLDSTDYHLTQRFKNLLESHKTDKKPLHAAKSKVFVVTDTENIEKPPTAAEEPREQDEPFVPFLNDIPRLPKFEGTNPGCPCKPNGKSRPPPSKGLTVARRFNNDINSIPHELSTIMESEASRLHRSKTPESQASKEASPVRKGLADERVFPMIITDPIDTDNSVKPKTPSSDSLPDILVELTNTANKAEDNKETRYGSYPQQKQQVVDLASDSSTSELENMEAMLTGLGMGWAVATLRKTQEALALASSSSSIDISVKQKEIKLTDSSSTSEISIRDILGRQVVRLSSSSRKSDESSSPSLFTKELQNISAIQGSGASQEKATVRTSTPVQSSKTTEDKSRTDSQPPVTFSGESELSSVRASSDGNCHCLPFCSLNESSIKNESGTKSN